MKRSWLSILIIVVMLGLLGLLAALQYRWLGQISDGERERLQKRLQNDTDRFAEDFNNEIQKAYFNFQFNADLWQKKDWARFNERYDFWKTNSPYPDLITNIYFFKPNEMPVKFDPASRSFENAELPEDLKNLSTSLFNKEEKFTSVDAKLPALIMPIYDEKDMAQITRTGPPMNGHTVVAPREKFAFLVIALNKDVIAQKLLPDLANKYFSVGENGDYHLAVLDQKDSSQVIFTNFSAAAPDKADATAALLDLSPDKMAFFVNRDLVSSLDKIRSANEKEGGSKVVVTQRWESKTSIGPAPKNSREKTFDLSVQHGETKPRIAMMESNNLNNEGVWLLNVQHRDGSLEQFITNTRNKNLAVSFGILGLLAVSVVLIFLSAQRAKNLAQRQLDFVSSVSHEFRTPLAVIYSAGENLTDGVVGSDAQVAEYGTLIKREGKKLSSMVEQILEFAGARSGRRKYDLRKTEVGQIMSDALAACRSFINESGFTVEKNIPEDLPPIVADEKALSHAFQNLINNAIKYSRGDKRLRITAENGAGLIKLSFEDRGLGISAREQSQIFEPFFRGKEVVAAQIHGNGLGLSLVKQIVEAHNGRVRVESRPGEGSKFTVELPL